MIIERIKNRIIVKCDLPGCENIMTKWNAHICETQYCCRKHYLAGRKANGIAKKLNATTKVPNFKDGEKCQVCKKPYSDDFYDKGIYTGRYLCSKDCRDIFYDNRPNDLVRNAYEKHDGRYEYVYPTQGRISGLANFNTTRIY